MHESRMMMLIGLERRGRHSLSLSLFRERAHVPMLGTVTPSGVQGVALIRVFSNFSLHGKSERTLWCCRRCWRANCLFREIMHML
jgi:hypothetical protein